MPCEITWEPHGVYKKFSGFIEAAEFVESTKAVHEDPRFDSLHYVINDLLHFDGESVTEAAIDYVAALWLGAQYSNTGIRVAFLATDARIKALIRRYVDAGMVPCPVEVFSGAVEARVWIDSRPPRGELVA